MFGRTFTVAKFTFLEAVRARFFGAVAMFAAASILVGGFLGGVPFGIVDDVILNLGWAAISGLTIVLSTFYCAQMIANERERRTLHLWMARPVSRAQYIWGKYLGLIALLSVTIILMTILLIIAVTLFGIKEHALAAFVLPCLWAIMKATVVTAYAIFFAVIASPLTAFFATFSVYVIGSSTPTLLTFAENRAGDFGLTMAKAIYYAFPNFSLIDVAERSIHGIGLPEPTFLLSAALVTLAYGVFAITAAAVAFVMQELT